MHARILSHIAVAGLFILAAPGTRAATLEALQGTVLVDRGNGFGIVNGPTYLNPGDSVIANPGGSAQIVYSDGCRIAVQPGDVVPAQSVSPCANGGSSPAAQESKSDESGGGGINSTTLLVGGAVVGIGAGAAALLLSGGDDDHPASP